MRVLITGVCGFVGSRIAQALSAAGSDHRLYGIDNFSRPGSELNRMDLPRYGVDLRHGDIRNPSDLEDLPSIDWVIDAAANPSVLAGVSGHANSRQLVEHNLHGTVNLLEVCKRQTAGFLMISTSRVYSSAGLASLPLEVRDSAYTPALSGPVPPGLSERGIDERFSTAAPLSLYGATKLASEVMALDYASAFGFPLYINRCGVLAGAGQFGKPDQGIFSFWIHSWCHKRPLRYIGFGGSGFQVRDCLHPDDLARLLIRQMGAGQGPVPRTINVSGGIRSAISLAQLSAWCADRFSPREIESDPDPRRFDVPWLILDSSAAGRLWNWEPERSLDSVLEEIAVHAEGNPDWLAVSGGVPG